MGQMREQCQCKGNPPRGDVKCSACQNAVRRATKKRNRRTKEDGWGVGSAMVRKQRIGKRVDEMVARGVE